MMCLEKSESTMKETLKNLCCSNGWCYGVLWGFDQNSLVLTIKDAYFEEQMGALIHSMILQAHVQGVGLVGQTAFTKVHQWVHSESDVCNQDQMQYSFGSFQGHEAFLDSSEFNCQFSVGIKTIALISVEPWGVVQLGSTQKISETRDFVYQVIQLFRGMSKCGNEFFDSYKGFTSLLSSTISDSMDHINSKHSMDSECCVNRGLMTPDESVPSASDRNSPFQPTDQPDHWPFQSGDNDLAYGCQMTSGSMESCQDVLNFAEVVPNHAQLDELSRWFSSQRGSSRASSSCTLADSILEHPSSPSSSSKRIRITDNFSWKHFDAKMDHEMGNIELNRGASRKMPVSCFVNISSAYAGEVGSSRRQKEPPKAWKKKAKPGTKPRPKDRQVIQNRLAELRNLIPNGDEMSIDRLLEQTARHLNFMQSLIKHAEILKQNDKSGGFQTDQANNAGGGVTWACKFGGD